MSGPSVSLTAGGALALAGLAALVLIGPTLARKAGAAAAAAAEAVNPLNHDNIFASGVNAVGGALVTDPEGAGKNADGSWSLGGALFDLWHPETAAAVRDVSQPVATPAPAVVNGYSLDNLGAMP